MKKRYWIYKMTRLNPDPRVVLETDDIGKVFSFVVSFFRKNSVILFVSDWSQFEKFTSSKGTISDKGYYQGLYFIKAHAKEYEEWKKRKK